MPALTVRLERRQSVILVYPLIPVKLSRRSFSLLLSGVGVASLAGGATTYGLFRDEETATGTVSAADSFPPAFALNDGGPEYTTTDGTTFQTGRAPDSGNSTISDTTDGILNTNDDPLLHDYRYGGAFNYDIAVDSGTYDVVLYTAETYWNNDGQRQFAVSVNGPEEISDLDMYADAGHDTAIVRTLSGTVPQNGTISLSFTADADNHSSVPSSRTTSAETWSPRRLSRASRTRTSGRKPVLCSRTTRWTPVGRPAT